MINEHLKKAILELTQHAIEIKNETIFDMRADPENVLYIYQTGRRRLRSIGVLIKDIETIGGYSCLNQISDLRYDLMDEFNKIVLETL